MLILLLLLLLRRVDAGDEEARRRSDRRLHQLERLPAHTSHARRQRFGDLADCQARGGGTDVKSAHSTGTCVRVRMLVRVFVR